MNVHAAELALSGLGLDILSDAEIAQWNYDKNQCGMIEKDVCLGGWVDEDGFFTKEFYVRSPREGEIGLYRKAWYGSYDGGDEPAIFVTDSNHNEVCVLQREVPEGM